MRKGERKSAVAGGGRRANQRIQMTIVISAMRRTRGVPTRERQEHPPERQCKAQLCHPIHASRAIPWADSLFCVTEPRSWG